MTHYYVAYDSAGAVVTRYDSDINAAQIASPPSGLTLLEVTDQSAMMQTASGGWTVVNGVLVAPTPLTAAQILEGAQTKQIATLTAAAEQAIQAGFVSSANGTALTYSLSFNDQRRALMSGQVAMSAMARATSWVASTPYTVNQIILQGGQYYICRVAGTTGATLPTDWPSACAVPMTDGGVTWLLFGLQLNTIQAGIKTKVWLTAQQIEAVFIDGTDWVNACDQQLATLSAQVMAATTVSDVQAVVWVNP